MRIAFVNQPWNPIPAPVEAGSIAIWSYEVARRLVAGGHDVRLYGMQRAGQPSTERHENIEYRRIPVGVDRRVERFMKRWKSLERRLVKRSASRLLFASSLYYAGYVLRVARDLRGDPVDVVHVQNLPQFVPIIRRRNPAARIVLHMHAEWLGQLDREQTAGRLGQADIIAGCSEYISNIGRNRFPEFADRFRTLYNGVDPDLFSPASERFPLPARLLYVGRISPEKGIHVLIDAFARLRPSTPGVILEITGPDSATPFEFLVGAAKEGPVAELTRFYPGSYSQQLRDRAIECGLAGLVRFTGPAPHSVTPSRYQQATLLVNPSLSEAFGMSLIEAMACGLPAVASRVGGMTEVVEEARTGVFVEAGDPDGLADSLRSLLSDRARVCSMGQAGRERVLARFSWDQVTGDVISAYGGVAARS